MNHSSDIQNSSDKMIKKQYKYPELTSKVIGCATMDHKTFGNGFQEVIYQRALEIEMRLANISFTREHEILSFTEMNKLEQEELFFWWKDLFRLS